MTTLNWKNTVMWTAVSLLFLLLALMVGPAPALAKNQRADVILYEVTEDMYLKDDAGNIVNADPSKATRRTAVAQLSGWAALGTPLCPYDVLVVLPKAKLCAVNATGADDLSLVTGKGTLGGTFTVVVQGDNATDAPEFVVMTGSFSGDADLSLTFSGAPLGFITNGVATIDGFGSVPFTGTFRLPFSLDAKGKPGKPIRHRNAFYLGDDFTTKIPVQATERSLGLPAVRLEIGF